MVQEGGHELPTAWWKRKYPNNENNQQYQGLCEAPFSMSGACLKLPLPEAQSRPHQQQAVSKTSRKMFRWLDLSPSLASERQKRGG